MSQKRSDFHVITHRTTTALPSCSPFSDRSHLPRRVRAYDISLRRTPRIARPTRSCDTHTQRLAEEENMFSRSHVCWVFVRFCHGWEHTTRRRDLLATTAKVARFNFRRWTCSPHLGIQRPLAGGFGAGKSVMNVMAIVIVYEELAVAITWQMYLSDVLSK